MKELFVLVLGAFFFLGGCTTKIIHTQYTLLGRDCELVDIKDFTRNNATSGCDDNGILVPMTLTKNRSGADTTATLVGAAVMGLAVPVIANSLKNVGNDVNLPPIEVVIPGM